MLAYLSGPMTGLPEYNYRAFTAAAARLRELGTDVLNPAETAGGVTHLPRSTFMHVDVGYVEAADCVIVLPGWESSRGAKLEVILADQLEKPIFTYDPITGISHQVVVQDLGVRFVEARIQKKEDSAPAPDPPAPGERPTNVLYLLPDNPPEA